METLKRRGMRYLCGTEAVGPTGPLWDGRRPPWGQASISIPTSRSRTTAVHFLRNVVGWLPRWA